MMEPPCTSNMINNDARFRYGCRPGKLLSVREKKRLFSAAAQAVVSYMLEGREEIRIEDIQLDIGAQNCGAIFIDERVSRNPEFQKMLAETSCLSVLKTLARLAMRR